MAKTTIKSPNILTIEFRQERGDSDYGSCLWANFNFDLERYELTIMSDCGNYAYGWVPTRHSESFMHLMARLDCGYLLDKIAKRNQVSDKATFANVKELIVECGIDPNNPDNLADHPELDMDSIESACNGYTESEVYQSLLKAFDGTPLEDCDGYDVICCVELDFTANAKKIAQIFMDYIKPICKEISEKEGVTNGSVP